MDKINYNQEPQINNPVEKKFNYRGLNFKQKEDTLSYLLFDYLSKIGTKAVFLVPGGGNMFLVDAVGRHPDIKCICTHNEQSAVIAAEAYSRLNKGIGVALVTTGPGATNSVTGIAGSWIDSIPLLVISGQVKTDDINFEKKLRQKGPQEVDIVSMVKGITKHSETITDHKNFLKKLSKIINLAKNGRPGPCLIDIPLDIQSQKVKIPFDYQPFLTNEIIKVKKQIPNDLIRKITKSKKPLFLMGHGIKSSKSQKLAIELIKYSNIPVCVTWPMIDLLAFDDPLYVGRPGVVAKRNANLTIQNCDLLISIGARLDRIVTAFNSDNFAKNAEIYCIDIDKAELKKHPKRFKTLKFDCKYFLSDLLIKLKNNKYKNKNTKWINFCKNLKTKYGKSESRKKKSMSIYNTVNYLSKIIPPNSTIVTGSSGLCIEVFYTHFENKKNQKTFLTTGLGSMGYGFPALVGASSQIQKKLFLFEGDGSAMMNLQELQTLKTNNCKAKIFLINNQGYVSIRNTQKNYFKGRFVGINKKSGMETSSISKIAKAIGIKSYEVKKYSDFNKIKKTLDKNELIIYEIFVNKDEKLIPKCSAYKLDNGTMVSSPIEDMTPLIEIEELKKIIPGPIDQRSYSMREVRNETT